MSDGSRVALLERWMDGKEGEKLEFKAAHKSFSFTELCKYCCALANEGGGHMILGVTNDRPRQVVGARAFPQPERTRKGLCEQMPLAFDFEDYPPEGPDREPGARVSCAGTTSRGAH